MTTEISKFFPSQFPVLPSAHYAHLLTLKVSDSPSILRTDEHGTTLARVGGVSRIQMLNRKNSTPQRLRGRERLRRLGFYEKNDCIYNDMHATCTVCPDCMIYGFASSEKGSSKSRYMGGSLYSVQPFSDAQQCVQRNSTSEAGVMTLKPNSKLIPSTALHHEHVVIEGTIFPSIETLRDVTFEGFLYHLQNLLEVKRYGAMTSRDGRFSTHVIGIVLSQGEIFSNLDLTKEIAEIFDESDSLEALLKKSAKAGESLLEEEFCQIDLAVWGDDCTKVIDELKKTFKDKKNYESHIKSLFRQGKQNLKDRS